MPVYRLALCLNSVLKKRVLLRALLSDCETSIFPEVLVSSSSSDPHPTAGWRWARPRGWWRRWCWSSCSAGTPSPGPSWTAAGSRDASTRPAQYSTSQYSTVDLQISEMFTCGVSTLWIMQVRFKKLFSPMKSSWSPWICVNDSEIMDNDTHLVLVSDIQLQLCCGSYLFQIFVVPLRNFICKKYLCRKAFCWSSSIYY